jgi:integrase/recombinase XerD
MRTEDQHVLDREAYWKQVLVSRSLGLNLKLVSRRFGGASYFRFAHIDGLICSDPAVHARLPKIHRDESRTHGLDRLELVRFLQVARTLSIHHGALA